MHKNSIVMKHTTTVHISESVSHVATWLVLHGLVALHYKGTIIEPWSMGYS